jgi:uncharacterized protein
MTSPNHQLVRDFFAGLSSGNLPAELFAPDMTAWTTTSGTTDKAKFLGGVKVLISIFGGTLRYRIDSLTAEEDRVVAEVRSNGTLVDGEDFHNAHVFIFRIRDGRIAAVVEHMNPIIVREKIVPLILAATRGA